MSGSPDTLVQQAIRQWLACADTFLIIPDALRQEWIQRWQQNPPASLMAWFHQFRQDIRESRNGYPRHPISRTAYTEAHIRALLKETGEWSDCKLKAASPTLNLSHDIDYLAPTLPMMLKRMISQRTWTTYPPGTQFLDSLAHLLELDSQAADGQRGVSTLFIPSPLYASKPWRWPSQWLIDPSYQANHPLFNRLRDLIDQYQCAIGLHGSFYSLADGFIHRERQALERALQRPVTLSRQHWLNLPTGHSLEVLQQTGFEIDSTLGWNGSVGFRGGMARPFPILLANGQHLWEMPLLLMDGPLFDDLKLDTTGVLALSQSLLDEVYRLNGCVSINWHERAAFSDYRWDDAYRELLAWSNAKGFRFSTMQHALKHRDSHHDTNHPPIDSDDVRSALA